MTIHYLPVLVCAVVAMVLGFIWYGPLFGKKWMEILGVDLQEDPEKKAEMQKAAMPLYIVQFFLALLQALVLAYYTAFLATGAAIVNALLLWLAFVMPTVATSSMWTNESGGTKWQKFLIQAGFQFVMFALFGFILGIWK